MGGLVAWLRVGQASRVFLGHLPSISDLGINNNKRKRFRVFKFHACRHFEFCDVTALSWLLFQTKEPQLSNSKDNAVTS